MLKKGVLETVQSSRFDLTFVANKQIFSEGLRVFSVCAPKLWNSLPPDIKRSASLDCFKKYLANF